MAVRTRNILSLCTGTGGLELGIMLALHHLGEAGRGICYVEREAAAAASLVASMEAGWLHPAPVWSDMLTFEPEPWRGSVHILASGDPCQDNSVAGAGAGAAGQRFLAPEVCRIAKGSRPEVVYRENVPGNAAGQLAAIVPPLERLGYRVAAGIFSSTETGNTMRRERLFIMACAEGAAGWTEQQPESARCRRTGPAGSDTGLDGTESGTRQLHSRSRRPRTAKRDVGGSGYDVDRTERKRSAPRRDHNGKDDRSQSGATSKRFASDLGGSGGTEPQGQQSGQHYAPGWQVESRSAALSGRTVLPPAVIPGPTDRRWHDVLDQFPEYQPALAQEEAQSHLLRGIDAMADRVERLRAVGNGVDPVVAAYAFLSLRALLRDGRTGAAQSAVAI